MKILLSVSVAVSFLAIKNNVDVMYYVYALSGLVKGGGRRGRGGRPERHLSKGRHVEVSKDGTKKVQKVHRIIPAYLLVRHS